MCHKYIDYLITTLFFPEFSQSLCENYPKTDLFLIYQSPENKVHVLYK